MNVKNNKRRKESIEKIEKAFINIIQTKEISEVSVSDICKAADINRSTFYANYLDIYDLADKVRQNLEKDFASVFTLDDSKNENASAIKFFRHIKDNQLFYKTYFKLCTESAYAKMPYDVSRAENDFNNEHIKYHIEFFKAGFNAIIKMWLAGGCKETPEEMAQILSSEYKGR